MERTNLPSSTQRLRQAMSALEAYETERIGPSRLPFRTTGTPLLFHVMHGGPTGSDGRKALRDLLKSTVHLRPSGSRGATRSIDRSAGDGRFLFFSVARDYEGSDTGLGAESDRPSTFDAPVLAFDIDDVAARGPVGYRAGDLIWPYAHLYAEMEGLDEDEAEGLVDADGGEVHPSIATVRSLRILADAATSFDLDLARTMTRLEALWLRGGDAEREVVSERARSTLVAIAEVVRSADLPRSAMDRVLRTLANPFWIRAPAWPASLGMACLGEVLLQGEIPVAAARFVAMPPASFGGHATWYSPNEL